MQCKMRPDLDVSQNQWRTITLWVNTLRIGGVKVWLEFFKEAEKGKQEIIKMVLQLKAPERYEVAEQIMQSL